jgi:hypothetical protein
MNLGHLRAFLARADVQALDDSIELGCEGHHGELCTFYGNEPTIKTLKRATFDYTMITAVILPHIDVGPEPD